MTLAVIPELDVTPLLFIMYFAVVPQPEWNPVVLSTEQMKQMAVLTALSYSLKDRTLTDGLNYLAWDVGKKKKDGIPKMNLYSSME